MMFDFGIRYTSKLTTGGWRVYMRAYRWPLDTKHGKLDFTHALRHLRRRAKPWA